MRTLTINLACFRSPRGYDKGRGKRLVRAAKYILFGSNDYVMTRERAEAFFDDDWNFDLACAQGS